MEYNTPDGALSEREQAFLHYWTPRVIDTTKRNDPSNPEFSVALVMEAWERNEEVSLSRVEIMLLVALALRMKAQQ